MQQTPTSRAPVAKRPPAENLRGVAWMLVSVIAASGMSLAVRELSADIDSRMIALLRSLLILAGLVVIWPILPGPSRRLRLSRPWLHVWRGGLIGLSTQLGFYTLANLPLATATVLFFTAPIFATILSVPVNGERVGPRRWAAVAAGFLGALIILRPGFGGFQPAMLAALGSSVLFATALVSSRSLAQSDGPFATYASSVVMTILVSAPLAAPVWALPSSGWFWAVALALAVTAAARGIADIQAYRYAEAAVIAPFTYLRLAFLGLAGWAFYGEVIDAPTWAGAAVIIAATLYIAQRERQLSLARKQALQAPAPGP